MVLKYKSCVEFLVIKVCFLLQLYLCGLNHALQVSAHLFIGSNDCIDILYKPVINRLVGVRRHESQ